MASDHVDALLEQWRRELPQLDHSSVAIIGRITRLAQVLESEIEPVFAEQGLNGGEFAVLAALRRSGRPFQLSPTELSRSLLVTSGGMTKRLATLERRGLVKRALTPADKRSSPVRLTAEGRRLVESVLPMHLANEQRLLAGISPKMREELGSLLRALAMHLEGRSWPTLQSSHELA